MPTTMAGTMCVSFAAGVLRVTVGPGNSTRPRRQYNSSQRAGTTVALIEEHASALMAAYQRGDLEAFETLYRQLAPGLLRYLTMVTRDRGRAEDLLQETFLQIHRSRRTYLPGRPVVPWAFAIARHVHLMDLRARSRRQLTEAPHPWDELPEVPVPPEAEGVVDRQGVQRALRKLPPDQLEAVVLHHVWGFTFREIGATLGIAAVTAKLRAFRGMKRLRAMLEGR